MMRDRIDSKWFPEHFAHYEPKKEVPYMAISGRDYVQCAKFDKDIVFTNKQAKLRYRKQNLISCSLGTSLHK